MAMPSHFLFLYTLHSRIEVNRLGISSTNTQKKIKWRYHFISRNVWFEIIIFFFFWRCWWWWWFRLVEFFLRKSFCSGPGGQNRATFLSKYSGSLNFLHNSFPLSFITVMWWVLMKTTKEFNFTFAFSMSAPTSLFPPDFRPLALFGEHIFCRSACSYVIFPVSVDRLVGEKMAKKIVTAAKSKAVILNPKSRQPNFTCENCVKCVPEDIFSIYRLDRVLQ